MLLPAGVSVLALLLLKLFVWLFGFPVSALTRCLALVHLTPNSPCMCRASSLFFPSGCGLMFSMLPSFSVSFVVWSLIMTFGLLGSNSLSQVLRLSLLLLDVEGLAVVG